MPAQEGSNPFDRDTFLTDHISYFAGARTNPYAIAVAAQICKDFKLSVAGQRRLNKALNDLPCLETADPGLSFAWSMDHIIRSPRVHEFGYEHLTIVVTLAECFHETYAAEVFHQMAKRKLPSLQSTPHIYQWLDLLHFCNGILATDDFGIVVENFILLDPYSVSPGGKYSSDRCLTPSESLATALIALSELTSGKRHKLTLRGGTVVGWLAALAEHFFDLTVAIESKQGVRLHGPTENAQLSLIYTDEPELVIEDSSTPAPAKEVSRMTLADVSKQIHFLPFGGRVTWQALLPQVFGERFHDLEHKHAVLMYTAIGTAFNAIESAKDPSSISPSQGPHANLAPQAPATTATQLILILTSHLSTLQRGQARMERQLKLSPQEAAKIHVDQMRQLATACECIFCTPAHTDATMAHGPISSMQTSTTNKPAPSSEAGYCLPAIVETTIMIGLMLSRIVLSHPLNPSREGVQLLYKLRTDHLRRSHPARDNVVLGPSPSLVAQTYDNVLNAPTAQVLRMCVKFFAGGHLPPLGSDLLPLECIAIAHEGMCAFAAEMAGGRGVRKDMKGMIRIVNGGFGIGRKTYKLAAWCAKRPGGWEGWQWDKVDVTHLNGEKGGKLWLK